MDNEKKWDELTPDEKREARFKNWLEAPGVKFDSPEAQKKYKARVTRIVNAYKLQEPDRVPVSIPAGAFSIYYAGGNLYQAMYDPELVRRAGLKYVQDFQDDMDYFQGSGITSGKHHEIIDYKCMAWPGHGLGKEASIQNFIEGENMKAEEYDDLIGDPSDWAMRTFLPRVVRSLGPLNELPSLVSLLGFPTNFVTPAANPAFRKALQAMIDSGIEQEKMLKANMAVSRAAQAAGLPSPRSAPGMAPFDTLGDILRGTREIFMDIFRRPQKVHKALERITELNIQRYKAVGKDINVLGIMFPLHKGDDTFMSDKQFAEFYWPTLKEVINGIVKEGLMVTLFAEGSYNNRLKQVADVPAGWVNWLFDRTDMKKAKQILGDRCCIMGNVPTSLMKAGTPQEVKEFCRKLIEDCGKGGGYILAGGASTSQTNAANLKAMMAAAKEYGVYK
jgi:uroporphyrinogen-III decarboxylase